MSTYYTITSRDPAFDQQYGNLLCAALLKHKEVVLLAGCIPQHVAGVLVIEVDAPSLNLDGVRDLVQEALMASADEVASIRRCVEHMSKPE